LFEQIHEQTFSCQNGLTRTQNVDELIFRPLASVRITQWFAGALPTSFAGFCTRQANNSQVRAPADGTAGCHAVSNDQETFKWDGELDSKYY
jgi:hypothetical protein